MGMAEKLEALGVADMITEVMVWVLGGKEKEEVLGRIGGEGELGSIVWIVAI